MFDAALTRQATELLERCRQQGFRLATAESCTGGLIAGCLTAVTGSSDVVDRGFVTYSNEAKAEVLGVPAGLIATAGAVSEPVAIAMAEGALEHSAADLAIACTGIAGPGGGSAAKPVGRVHMAVARRGGLTAHAMHDYGPIGRDQVRLATVRDAIQLALAQVT